MLERVLQKLKPVLSWNYMGATISCGLSWLTVRTADGRTARFSGPDELTQLKALFNKCIVASVDPMLAKSKLNWHCDERIGNYAIELSFFAEGNHAGRNCSRVNFHVRAADSHQAPDYLELATVEQLVTWLAEAMGTETGAIGLSNPVYRLYCIRQERDLILQLSGCISRKRLLFEPMSTAKAKKLQLALLAAASSFDYRQFVAFTNKASRGTVSVTAGGRSSHPIVTIENCVGSRSCAITNHELVRLAAEIECLLEETA